MCSGSPGNNRNLSTRRATAMWDRAVGGTRQPFLARGKQTDFKHGTAFQGSIKLEYTWESSTHVIDRCSLLLGLSNLGTFGIPIFRNFSGTTNRSLLLHVMTRPKSSLFLFLFLGLVNVSILPLPTAWTSWNRAVISRWSRVFPRPKISPSTCALRCGNESLLVTIFPSCGSAYWSLLSLCPSDAAQGLDLLERATAEAIRVWVSARARVWSASCGWSMCDAVPITPNANYVWVYNQCLDTEQLTGQYKTQVTNESLTQYQRQYRPLFTQFLKPVTAVPYGNGTMSILFSKLQKLTKEITAAPSYPWGICSKPLLDVWNCRKYQVSNTGYYFFQYIHTYGKISHSKKKSNYKSKYTTFTVWGMTIKLA